MRAQEHASRLPDADDRGMWPCLASARAPCCETGPVAGARQLRFQAEPHIGCRPAHVVPAPVHVPFTPHRPSDVTWVSGGRRQGAPDRAAPGRDEKPLGPPACRPQPPVPFDSPCWLRTGRSPPGRGQYRYAHGALVRLRSWGVRGAESGVGVAGAGGVGRPRRHGEPDAQFSPHPAQAQRTYGRVRHLRPARPPASRGSLRTSRGDRLFRGALPRKHRTTSDDHLCPPDRDGSLHGPRLQSRGGDRDGAGSGQRVGCRSRRT